MRGSDRGEPCERRRVRVSSPGASARLLAALAVAGCGAVESGSGGRDFDRLCDFDVPDATERRLLERLNLAKRDGSDDAYRCELMTQFARSRCLQGRHAEARGALAEATALGITRNSVAGVRLVLEQGRVEWKQGNLEAARARFREALEVAGAIGADYHAVDASHMLGVSATGAEGLRWTLQAIAMARASRDDDVRRWLPVLLDNASNCLRSMGQVVEADRFQTMAEESRRRESAGAGR